MLPRSLQWILSSRRSSNLIYRCVHSGSGRFDQARDVSVRPGEAGSQTNPATNQPSGGTFRGHPHSAHNNQQPNPPSPQFARPPTPNHGHPSFHPGNPYNQPFPNQSQYRGPQPVHQQWDYRVPPHFYQAPPQNAPWSAPQQYPPTYSPPREGFNNPNRAQDQSFQPQNYSSPVPPHIAHPRFPLVQPQSGSGPFAPNPYMIPPTQQNAPLQPSAQRSNKVGNFDLQDLDLDQFAAGSSKPSLNSNPRSPPQQSVDPRTGYPRGAPYSQPWGNNNPNGATNYPPFPSSPNFNSRNSDRNKSRMGGSRGSNNNNTNTRRMTGPNQFRRDKGRGLLMSKPEPQLPPPPKTIFDERGEYGTKLTPLGVPENMAKYRPREASLVDYQTLPNLITESNKPIKLPGFPQPLQFDSSNLQVNPLLPSTDVSWSNGTANKHQTVDRALNLISHNPSFTLAQKRISVGLVDFLLCSKDERLARMKSE